MCVRQRERERERESACVCVCVCEIERERERKKEIESCIIHRWERGSREERQNDFLSLISPPITTGILFTLFTERD